MPTLTTSPWDKAVDRLSKKTAVGSALRTAKWAAMPVGLREGSFFSAGMTKVQILSAMQSRLKQGLEQSLPGGTGMDRSRFVAEMRDLMGAVPGDTGDLTDITSSRRLELIWDFQTADAHGYAAHKMALDPDIMDAFPAYRLVRVESRRFPRQWAERWVTAGAKVGWEGASKTAMVALKTSPLWVALSRFGRAWPPFDFNSGMGQEDVDRAEAEDLGLLPRNEPPADRMERLTQAGEMTQRRWQDSLAASTKSLEPESHAWIKDAFGDQVKLQDDTVQWVSDGGGN